MSASMWDRPLIYRRDIDGLRGVAVLAVVAYHVGISALSGGFLGVDIFFVISGYLITSKLASDAANGSINLLAFWTGRLRRLWPALAATLLVSGMLAYLLLYPTELRQFARSALAAAFGVSNIYFYLYNTDYFQASLAGTSALLHTWTLGVEAQFYVLLPLVIALQARYRIVALPVVLAILGVVSLAFSLSNQADPDAAFFLLPSRIWEFLVGSLLAITPIATKAPNRIAADLAGLVGFALIAASIYLASERSPVIGLAALAPCFGAAAVIWAGQNASALTHRLMSFPPLVGLGKISYSVYLWHWPLIIFLHMLFVSLAGRPLLKLSVIAASLVMGWASWQFVELPFRYGRFRPSNRRLLQGVGLTVGLITAGGVAVIAGDGLPGRFPSSANQMQAFLNYNPSSTYRQGSCYVTTGTAAEYDRAVCLQWDASRHNVLLLGDSHAAHLWFGLAKAFPEMNLMQATASGCRPLYEIEPPGSSPCKALMKSIYDGYLHSHKVEALLLAGRWQMEDLKGISATLDWANQNKVRVILIGPIVEYDSPLPRLLAGAMQQKNTELVSRHQSAKPREIDLALSEIAARHDVDYLSLRQMMCKEDGCIEIDADGKPIQFDYGHLTKNGSTIVGNLIRKAGLIRFPVEAQTVVAPAVAADNPPSSALGARTRSSQGASLN